MRRRLMHAMVPTSSSGIPRRRLIWLIGLRERRNAEPRDRAEREAGDQLADGVREREADSRMRVRKPPPSRLTEHEGRVSTGPSTAPTPYQPFNLAQRSRGAPRAAQG